MECKVKPICCIYHCPYEAICKSYEQGACPVGWNYEEDK